MKTEDVLTSLYIISTIIAVLQAAGAFMVWLRIRKLPIMKYFSLLSLITWVTEILHTGVFFVRAINPNLALSLALITIIEAAQLVGWFFVTLFIAGIVNGVHPITIIAARPSTQEPAEFVG